MKRSKKPYPNLYKFSYSPNWIYRKFSKEKNKEFTYSTGIPATKNHAAAAYKKGVEKYNEWLGVHLPGGQDLLVCDIARAVLASKANKKKRTEKTVQNQIVNHILPYWGHYHPSEVTPLKWKLYDEQERAKGERKALANTRKTLLEILNRAKDEGLITSVPRLKNFDPKSAPPKYIPHDQYCQIRRKLPPKIRFLVTWMYRMGARPTEVLQYRWDMINWETGKIHIPGAITKTGRERTIQINRRMLRHLVRLRPFATSSFIFPGRWKSDKPLTAYNAVWDRCMGKLGPEEQPLDLTIYNLRDTWITNKLKEGFSSVFIGKYTDTSSAMIDKKYAVAEEEIMGRIAG